MGVLITVKRSQVRANPFNHKCSFQDNEREALEQSLKEFGMIGALVVIPDYAKKAEYILLDGHSRSSMLDEFQAVVYEGDVNNDDDLKKLTLYYLSATKRRDSKKLSEMFFSMKTELPSLDAVFAKIKIDDPFKKETDSLTPVKDNIKDIQDAPVIFEDRENPVMNEILSKGVNPVERFSEMVMMEFTSEATYQLFIELKGRGFAIGSTGKVASLLNSVNKLKDLDSLMEIHLMELLLKVYKNG